MAHDVIATCPVCQHELSVTRLHCGECGTTLEGDFSVGRFGRLSREQLSLLESFLRSRGNLREMERELGLSYPTVRSRVDALVRALGLGGAEAGSEEPSAAVGRTAGADPEARRSILERLARREIGAEEAAAALRARGVEEGGSDVAG
ncbi:MAG: DUF2089 domain-containing protein [Chloroflexi bacterium]|jgi:hypothetical protein|nr:DUF2089 domain-containing protein [Chloroflexota bacterium]